MPRIPLPNTPDVQAAPYAGAAPADTSAKYRGSIALARGVGDVGGAMFEFAQRSAAVKNEGDLAKAKLAMEKARADIALAQEGDADFSKWEQVAAERLKEAEGEVLAGDLAPAVRQKLQQDFAAFRETTETDVRYQALRARNNDAAKSLQTLAAMSYQRGDIEGGDEMLNKQAELGIRTANEVALAKAAGRAAADEARVNEAMALDPLTAEEQLKVRGEDKEYSNFRHLSPDRRLAMIREAEIRSGKLRAETQQDIAQRIYQGEFVSKEELDGLVESGHLKATTAKWLMTQQTSTSINDPQVRDMAVRISQQITKFDPSQPGAEIEYWKIFGEASTLPSGMREQLVRDLNGAKNNDPVAAKTRTGDEYIEAMQRGGFYGNVRLQGAGDDAPGQPSDSAGYSRSQETVLRLKNELRDFLREKPNATPQEIREFLQNSDRKQRVNASVLLNGSTGQRPRR